MTGTMRGDAVTLIRLNLRIIDRWAVGGVGDASDEIDLPVLTDPRKDGRTPHLPGTTLAGNLRRHLGATAAEDWLGPEPTGREESTGTLQRSRSRLAFLGAHVAGSDIRHRGVTAVNNTRGAAQEHTLRIEEWAEPAHVTVVLEHDGPPDTTLTDALLTWRPILGRSASTGMGRTIPLSVETVTIDLGNAEHLSWWLTKRHTWYTTPGIAPPKGTATATPDPADPEAKASDMAEDWAESFGSTVLDVEWDVAEPVHIGGGDDLHTRASGDAVPSVTGTLRGRRQHLGENVLIPGSTWKGIYRHRVEFMLRAIDCPDTTRTALIERLFGSTKTPGILTFEDSTGSSDVITRTHVAIDRFTGGALDSALYTIEAAAPGMRLRQRIRSTIDVPQAEANLLRHVVRDLNDGLIGVGGNASRGYGSIRIHDPKQVTTAQIDVAELVACATREMPETS